MEGEELVNLVALLVHNSDHHLCRSAIEFATIGGEYKRGDIIH